MKVIKNKEVATCLFRDLEIGDCFALNLSQDVLMKTIPYKGTNAVDLSTGYLLCISSECTIIPCYDAEVVLNAPSNT